MKCNEPKCKRSAMFIPYIAFYSTTDIVPGFEVDMKNIGVCQKHIREDGTFEDFFGDEVGEEWRVECRRIFLEVASKQKGNVVIDEDRLRLKFKKLIAN